MWWGVAAFCAGALVASGCAPLPPVSTVDAAQGMAQLPTECYVRAALTGPVAFEEKRGDASNDMTRLYSVKKYGSAEQASVICGCNDKYNMSMITMREANRLMEVGAQANGWVLDGTNLSDSQRGKIYRFNGHYDGFMGSFVGKGAIEFSGKCFQGVASWVRRGTEDKLDPYIASAYDVKTSRYMFAPPPIGGEQPGRASDRLRELKSLRDQGLVTQQEYDERRRAILSGV